MEERTYTIERNYQSKVRAFCIALLNKYADVEIKITSKHSHLTLPLIRIVELRFNEEDIINIYRFVKKRAKELEDIDVQNHITEKAALYRKKKNIYRETINLVIDLIRELGFEIRSTLTTGRNNTIRVEVVSTIRKDGIVYDKRTIERIGEHVCIDLVNRIGNSNTIVLRKNDQQIGTTLFSLI